MSGRALALALVIAGAGCGGVQPGGSDGGVDGGTLHVDPAALQAALDQARVAEGWVGVVARVRVGDTAWTGTSGLADVAAGTPMPADGLFRIGSTTKSFVATCVLQLVAAGKVALTDTLDGWAPSVPNAANITVRQLLDHTSGLYNYTDSTAFTQALAADPQKQWAPLDLVGYATQQPPYFAPGQGYHYSNTNFILLGLLIEKVTGQPLPAALRAQLLDPLGLQHTFFVEDEPIARGQLVRGYHHEPMTGGGFTAPMDITDATSSSWAWAAGALVSDIDDVTTFFHALIQGSLLPAALLTDMETPEPAPTGARWQYGLGLIIRQSAVGTSYGHGGHALGYYAWATDVPAADLQITLLFNVEANSDDVNLDRVDATIGALGATLTP